MLGDHCRDKAKRLNLKMDEVAKAREMWSEERQQRLDYLNKQIAQRKHAARTFTNLEVAEEEYYRVTGHRLSTLRDEPKLSDFYNPSRQRKDAEIVLSVAGMRLVSSEPERHLKYEAC